MQTKILLKTFIITRHLLWFCSILLAFLPIKALAVTEFKIITLQHRFVEDILPMIQPLAGEDGAVTGMQNHIIIRANPERMLEIEQAIATLDVAQQNLKITVSHQNKQQTSRDGVAVSGQKRIGNVVVGTNRYPANTRNSRDGVGVDIENSQRNMRNQGEQFINVLDGGQAFIRVGQSVPFTQEWMTYMRRYIRIHRTTEFVDISTGFAVRARSIGRQIELEITPRIAQLNQAGFIDFEELSTIVRTNKGEWFDLGGAMSKKDEVSRAILSRQNTSQTQDSALSIRVE